MSQKEHREGGHWGACNTLFLDLRVHFVNIYLYSYVLCAFLYYTIHNAEGNVKKLIPQWEIILFPGE